MPSHILATGGYDHQIRLWEVSSGFCYRTLQHADSVPPVSALINDFRLSCRLSGHEALYLFSCACLSKSTN